MILGPINFFCLLFGKSNFYGSVNLFSLLKKLNHLSNLTCLSSLRKMLWLRSASILTWLFSR